MTGEQDRTRAVLRPALATLAFAAERLFQGPVADGLTHVGSLALLRRLASDPVPGENCFSVEIVTGQVGIQQARPVRVRQGSRV